MTSFEIILLIISGLVVGFINTLAGGGTIISLSLFMFMGIPADIANGTNRVAVILQNITSVYGFKKKDLLPLPAATYMTIPTVIGSVLGALLSAHVSAPTFRLAFGVVMVIMVFFLVLKPDRWLVGRPALQKKRLSGAQYIIFFLIGIYGGFIQVGVGYFLLAAAVLGSGYDILRANAIKVYVVLFYTLFAIVVFILNGKVYWQYGLTHAIGNVMGAYIATRWAVGWGTGFVRWFIVVVILFLAADMFGLIHLTDFLARFLN